MKRAQLLLLFVALSSVFLVLQIFLIRNVSKSGTVWSSGVVQHYDPLISSYENTQMFLLACHSHSKLVFLIDPALLSNVMSNVSQPTPRVNCKYLCVQQSLTVFGILGKLWKQEESLITSLKQQNFSVLHFTEHNPGVPDTAAQPVSTHYFFRRQLHSIHLVVFYERSDNYWWHGALENNAKTRTQLEHFAIGRKDLSLGQHAGAFDKIELAKVTIDGLQLRAPRFPSLFLHQLPHSRFIECNYTRAQNFYKQYGKDESLEATQFKKAALELLATAKQTLNELGVRFWLSSGTCLGWFRQCDIIPYSKDVDFGMWIKDYQTSLLDALQLNGLQLKHMFGKVSDSYELSFTGGDVKLDIFFFYEEGDYMWNGGTQARTGDKYKYLFPKFTLCWTEFLSHRVRVPCDTLTYITANYGDQWFEPVKEWDWKQSPPNVRPNGKWAESERSKVIQTYEPVYKV